MQERVDEWRDLNGIVCDKSRDDSSQESWGDCVGYVFMTPRDALVWQQKIATDTLLKEYDQIIEVSEMMERWQAGGASKQMRRCA